MVPSVLAAVVAVAAAAAPAPAADPKPGTPVAGLALVHPDGTRVFVPAAAGGIEAVDLATGKVVWRATSGDRLAGANAEVVFAWAADPKTPHGVRVSVIDAASGKVVATSDPVMLPDWSVPVTEQGMGKSFRAAARGEDGKVVFVWQAGTSYFGGAAPPPEVERAARKNAAGVAVVDPATGKVTATDRVPWEDEFKAGPLGGSAEKVGGLTFAVQQGQPDKRFKVKRTLVVSRDGKPVLEHEVAGTHMFPPPP